MAAVEYNLNFTPLPKQAILFDYVFNQGVDEILFGGAAGSGKSFAAAGLAAYAALKYPGITIGCFGVTRPSIQETVMSKLKLIAPEKIVDKATGKTKRIWKYSGEKYTHYLNLDEHNPTSESRIIWSFLSPDKPNLVEATHNGKEYQIDIFDECTLMELKAIKFVTDTRTRHSFGRTEHPIRKIFLTNAGGRSSSYFKENFVDVYKLEKVKQGVKFPIWEVPVIDPLTKEPFKDPKTGKQLVIKRAFIPATITDNPDFYGSMYHANLMNASEKEKQYKLYGNWDHVPGKMFDGFDVATHTITKEESDNLLQTYINNDQVVWSISMDYGGLGDELIIQWATNDENDLDHVFMEDSYVGWSDEQVAEDILNKAKFLSRKYNWSRKPTLILPHDVFRKANQKIVQEGTGEVLGQDTAELYQKIIGLNPIKASSNRREGWRSVNRQINKINATENREERGKSSFLLINKECYRLINQLNTMQAKADDPEEILANQVDHSLDAFRYYMVTKEAARSYYFHEEEVNKPAHLKTSLDRKKELIMRNKIEYDFPGMDENDAIGYLSNHDW